MQRIYGGYLNIDSENNNNKLYVNNLGENKIALKSTNGYYISYNNPDSVLMSSAEKIGKSEIFVLIPHKEYFKLKTIG